MIVMTERKAATRGGRKACGGENVLLPPFKFDESMRRPGGGVGGSAETSGNHAFLFFSCSLVGVTDQVRLPSKCLSC